MKRMQERKYSMYKTVLSILQETNSAIIAKMPQMDVAIAKLISYILLIENTTKDQVEDRKGFKASKEVTKDDVINTIFVLAGQVKSFAVNTNNLVLRNEVNFTISKLKSMADGLLNITAILIIEKAEENLPNLTPYGVTDESLSQIKQLVTIYANKMSQPRIGIVDKSIATKNLKLTFKKTDNLLDENMDTLVIIVKNDEKQFFNTYKNNRKIINPAHFTLALRCNITNPEGQPIEKVTATIKGITKKHKTSAKGNFHIKSLSEGMHEITFSKPGYYSQIVNVPITKGQRTDLHIIIHPSIQTQSDKREKNLSM